MNKYICYIECGLKSIIFTKFMGVFGIHKQHKNLISHGPNSRYTIVPLFLPYCGIVKCVLHFIYKLRVKR